MLMTRNQNLKQLAKKTYMSYHQDGLVDLLVGWVIIAFAAMMAFDQSAFLFLGLLAGLDHHRRAAQKKSISMGCGS